MNNPYNQTSPHIAKQIIDGMLKDESMIKPFRGVFLHGEDKTAKEEVVSLSTDDNTLVLRPHTLEDMKTDINQAMTHNGRVLFVVDDVFKLAFEEENFLFSLMVARHHQGTRLSNNILFVGMTTEHIPQKGVMGWLVNQTLHMIIIPEPVA